MHFDKPQISYTADPCNLITTQAPRNEVPVWKTSESPSECDAGAAGMTDNLNTNEQDPKTRF